MSTILSCSGIRSSRRCALRAGGGGRRYADMLHEEVFEPLGMRDTSLGPREDLVARLCPVRAAYGDLPSLTPKEAIEAWVR